MGIFGSLFHKRQGGAPDSVRETLFGDMPLEDWPSNDASSQDFPWSLFVSAQSDLAAGRIDEAVASWRQVLAHPGLEPRHYLQAWHFLRQQGMRPPAGIAQQVLGVVVEVALPKGLDLLAAYSDHSARYFNYSGAAVVWEHPDSSMDSVIDQLFEAANQVVSRIGPWEKPRPAAPPRDQARLSFLTPGGLHFGQGPMAALSRDPLGGRALQSATELMRSLVDRAN